MLKMNQLVKNDKAHQALYDNIFKEIAELRDRIDDVYSLHLDSKGMSIPEIDRHNHDIRDELNELKEEVKGVRKNIGNLISWSMDINTNREVLREFMKIFSKPLDDIKYDAYGWTENYTIVEKLLEKLDSGGEKSGMGLVHAEYPNRSADDVGVIDSEPPEPKCFMGDCAELYNKDDPCEDYEARQGKWGECHEYKDRPPEPKIVRHCGNCKYDGDDCDECNRKQMGWALSKKAAKELERKIIDLKE